MTLDSISDCPAPAWLAALQELYGGEDLLTEAEDLMVFSFDGTAALKQRPGAVV